MANEQEILQNAANALTRLTGLKCKHRRKKSPGRQQVDAEVMVETAGREVRFRAEVKTRVTRADALLAVVKNTERAEEFLLVTPWVPETMAERFREGGIQFMDAAGNAFLDRPPLYIFITGNKKPESATVPTVGRAFKPTGLKLLFALLCIPGLENQPYRVIAAKAGVALGMVNWVMKELKELGFLLETGTTRARQARLLERERLLERWITGYAEQLRPKLAHGRYRGAAGWWQDARLQGGLWGGEVAAAKLTGHLKPEVVTIYLDEDDPAAVLTAHKLRKDPDGEVELLYRFWQPDTIPPHGDTVHPLLVYADLLASGNQRNLETARMIYDQHIVRLVRDV
jgi:hypothetical protein